MGNEKTKRQPTGTHLLIDLYGVDAHRLSQANALEALLRTGAQRAGATILNSHFHGFGAGQGITGVVLLAESHISIHTWPECGYAALDIFMCGAAQPQIALESICQTLRPRSSAVRTIARGNSESPIVMHSPNSAP